MDILFCQSVAHRLAAWAPAARAEPSDAQNLSADEAPSRESVPADGELFRLRLVSTSL